MVALVGQLKSANHGTIGTPAANATTGIVEFNSRLANLKGQLALVVSQCEEQTEIGAAIDGVEAIIERVKSSRDLNAAFDVATLSIRLANLTTLLANVDSRWKYETHLAEALDGLEAMKEQLEDATPESMLELDVVWTEIEDDISKFQTYQIVDRMVREEKTKTTHRMGDLQDGFLALRRHLLQVTKKDRRHLDYYSFWNRKKDINRE